MAICSSCQFENTASAKFCSECGGALQKKCRECGVDLQPTAKFCSECGTSAVAVQPSAAEAQPAIAAPTSYTPKHLAEKIISSRSAIEGERKLVTVLFADLKGSTEMVADRDPEAAQQILDPLLNLMMEAVHFYEGTVSLVLGDGLMAIFGAPVAHEDHAVRACYAALRIQENTAKLAEKMRVSHKLDLSVRVGLNSGDVVVRSVGTDLRMDYSAIGHTTHLASRMEQLADPGTVFMGPSTVRLVEGYVQVQSRGERDIKGLDAPLEVFELLGASAVQSRLQAAVARGLTGFLGRETEVELIQQSLARVGELNGQIVALSGEAGIGKSRLIWEFVQSLDPDAWAVMQAGTSAYGKSVPYAPIISILNTYFGLENRMAPSDIEAIVRSRLSALDAPLEALASGVLSLLGCDVSDPHWSALDPAARRRNLINGLRQLLFFEAQIKPLLIVIDDLHWIDDETQEVLNALVDGLPSTQIFLLVGYRPEYEHDWVRKSYFREIRIAPLPHKGASAFLDSLLGMDMSLLPLKELLITRTDGNPFFMEESIRTLHEMNFIGGSAGQYKLLKAAETVRIPESAKAILSARIDRLSETDKRVLQAAAVIGKDIPIDLVTAVADTTADEVRQALEHLQSLEFLYETSLFPQLIYSFRHALVQEVAYDSLLNERRIRLHRAIYEVLNAEGASDLKRVSALARHSYRGELWVSAAEHLGRAGEMAMGISALPDADGFFSKALRAVAKIPDPDSAAQLKIDLQFGHRSVLVLLGKLQQAKSVLLSAQAVARTISDAGRNGRATAMLCNLYWELGEQDLAIEQGLTALKIGEANSDEKTISSARRYLARAYQAVGDYQTAINLYEACLSPDRSPGPSEILIRAFMSNCHGELGLFAQRLDFAKKTVDIAETVKNPLALSAALSSLGRIHLRHGRFEQAVGPLERALKIARQAEIELLYPFAAAPLGAAYGRLGRTKEGEKLLVESIERSEAMNRMVDAALWRYWHGRVLILKGDLTAAKVTMDRGLALSITYKERGNEAGMLVAMGDLHLAIGTDDLSVAETSYRKALKIADELGLKPTQSRAHHGLSQLLLTKDVSDKASHHAVQAQTIADEIGADFWLRPADQK